MMDVALDYEENASNVKSLEDLVDTYIENYKDDLIKVKILNDCFVPQPKTEGAIERPRCQECNVVLDENESEICEDCLCPEGP